MKKFLIVLLISFPCLLFGQTISFGGAYLYGFTVKGSGVNLRVLYYPVYRLSVAAEYNYFFPKTINEELIKRSDLFLNFRYYFPVTDKIRVYPLVGIAWDLRHTAQTSINELTFKKESEGGINSGLGIVYHRGKAYTFAEIQNTFGLLGQAYFVVGIGIKQQWK